MSFEPVLISALHVLAAVIWVGGMFFAYVCLRPASGDLEGPVRLSLWRRTLARFLAVVWVAVAVLLVTGYRLGSLLFGGVATFPVYVHLMHGIAWLMTVLFLVLYFGAYRRLGGALDRGDTAAAAQALGGVRRIVAANLALGLVTVVVASGGRFLGM